GQKHIFLRIDEIDQPRRARVHDIHAPQRHRDDLRPGRLQSIRILGIVFVFTCADDQTRTEAAPGENEGPVFHDGDRRARIIAAADEVYDFETITIGKTHLPIAGTGYDREIP